MQLYAFSHAQCVWYVNRHAWSFYRVSTPILALIRLSLFFWVGKGYPLSNKGSLCTIKLLGPMLLLVWGSRGTHMMAIAVV